MAVASGNALTGAETTAFWDCTSLLTSTHVNYCADVAATPWGPCDGTCLFNDQAAMPELYLSCFTAPADIKNIMQNSGNFLLTFDVMIVWLPNSTVPNDPPASQIQVNAMIALATINQSSWIPVLSKSASSGSFTSFSWRSIIPSQDYTRTSASVKINLDHAPAGNGSYGIYVDKVVLSAFTPTSSGSSTLSATVLASTATALTSGQSSTASRLTTASGNQTALSSIIPSGSSSQQNNGDTALSSSFANSPSNPGGSTTASSNGPPFNSSMLVGTIVGLLGLLFIAICAYLWVRRAQRRKASHIKLESSLHLSSPPYTRTAYPVIGDHKNALLPINAKADRIQSTPTREGIAPAYDLDRPPAYDDAGQTTPGGSGQSPLR
ncbi:hypothetical protein M408DRAFT_300227 [Serendipita vermifera MAFF 305830]|uniref:Uncharacterized protein n=1 Tax=Serendipita vermifera MAFF 305830 TaxID=933852 RepID=A0A0C3ARD1_SERVB|nr:hypothetical protein M408DRAFT_300227 [Serendipita vermifera MAFF 305830]